MSLDAEGRGTPLDHYREAEELLKLADRNVGTPVGPFATQLAIGHALLAGCHMTAGVWGEKGPPA